METPPPLSVLMGLLLDEFVFILKKQNTREGKTIRHKDPEATFRAGFLKRPT